mgnify:CR=1 FL=1
MEKLELIGEILPGLSVRDERFYLGITGFSRQPSRRERMEKEELLRLRREYGDPRGLMRKKIALVGSLLRKGGKLLDVGCGTGELIEAVSGFHDFVVGIDVSNSCVEFCKARLRHLSGVEIIHASADDIGWLFRREVFNVCTVLDVLEHLQDPRSVLKGIHEVLLNRGQIVVTCPNWYDKIEIAARRSPHVRSFSSFGWKKLLEKSGFQCRTVRAVGFPVLDVEPFAKYLHVLGMCVVIVAEKT